MSIDAQSPPHAGSGTGPSTVSSSGIEAIETSLDHVEPLLQISEAIETVYDVESTAAELLRGGWTRVCLQFPDELLHDSVPVFKAVRARLPDAVEVYVMADTTYGSCCVDEVAAQHVDAQVVVHYGHACLSAPSRLPVLYVFPKAPIDAEHAAIALVDQLQDGTNTAALSGRSTLLLLSDVAYSWKLEEIYARLCDTLQEKWTIVRSAIDTKAYLAEPSSRVASQTSRSAADAATTAFSTEGGAQVPSSCCSPVNAIQPAGGCCSAAGETASSGCCQSGTSASSPLRPSAAATSTGPQNTSQRKASCRSYTLPPGTSLESDTVILYVGPESLAMTNLLLSNASTPVVSYLPDTKTSSGKGTARLESGRTNKLLMRRYGTIARARDADVYGIVVGTLGVSSYLPTLAYLRKLLKKHQKKSYTMAVGKLTPAKLGNFLEVETWVLVACGENSLVEAHKEFLKPIITPWELEVALGERDWLAASEVDGGTGERKQGYTLDFTDVLGSAAQEADSAPASGADALQGDLAPGGDGQEADSGEVFGDDPDGPIFSTATGTYRYRRTYGDAKADVQSAAQLSAAAGQLSLRNNQSALASVLSSAGGEHLAGRTYRGLDPRFGQDAASAVEQGRSGVAREYGGDREAQGVDAEERE